MNNCIVAQSGGPTAAINASLAGVISGVINSEKYDKIYGSIHGIQGVFQENFIDLTDSSDEFISQVKFSPAMYLGSCRFKLPSYENDLEKYEQIFKIFEKYEIKAFFYIGGNDSMDTVAKLSTYAESIGSDIKFAGVPKTIDNDLILTDHTPGFGSAAKYVAASVREIAYDTYIYALESVLIVEVMGRDAGWLTASAALARTKSSPAPHRIYLPEVDFDEEFFIEDLKKLVATERNIIIAVSEGIHDKDGNYIAATNAVADKFGHAQLSGAGKYLEMLVKERLGIKVRSVEINVLQRCAGHMASAQDIEEAFVQGETAVTFAASGKTSFMAAIKCEREPVYSYEVIDVPVCEVANQAKAVPREWINEEGCDVTEEMVNYISPLIKGEVTLNYEDGLPSYPSISHLTHHE